MNTHSQRWRSGFAVTLSLGLTVVGLTASLPTSSQLPGDLQSYCESLASTPGRQGPTRILQTRVERTITLPGSAQLILGAQWNPSQKTLTVFEGPESRLTILDSLGQIVGTVGRRGDGPEEFRLSPVYVGSRQKFRFADDRRVLVLDDRFGHVFSGTRQIQEVRFSDATGILATDVHVARMSDAWVVSMANRRAADAASRSLVRLYRVRDMDGPRQSPQLLTTVKNVASQAPATAGRAPNLPYDDLYRRTWDAVGQTLAIVSYHHFSICIGNPADSASWRAWSVGAVPRQVTAAEQDRILKARFGATRGPIPMMGGRIEDYFRGKWPRTAPFHYDITSLNDSTFAALRLDPDGGITADLINVRRGYRGSMKIPPSRFVIGGFSDGLLILNFADAEIEFLGAVDR
jgi:hypothetical protein